MGDLDVLAAEVGASEADGFRRGQMKRTTHVVDGWKPKHREPPGQMRQGATSVKTFVRGSKIY
jgi:hypothetical protein